MKALVEKGVDPELWHACAGGTVEIPEANSRVFYFPQGHAEHAFASVDFGVLPRIPPMIPCRVAYVKFLADPETDEVYARIGLTPLRNNDAVGFDDGGVMGSKMSESSEKPTSFAKTLTQSDANNGGGFSVPRYCAETIFPRLDYTADPPVQNVIAKDIHGDSWKFRHIYRGTPRRHLLTTGWSTFVNHKKLVAGDSIVFLRSENGDLCVGIRRVKRECGGGLGGYGTSSLWNYDSTGNSRGGFPGIFGDESMLTPRNAYNGKMRERGRVRPETVLEAAFMAVNGHPFEIIYYPRAGTPEFCVKASSVRDAMRTQWCPGMRFKMAFENDDSSRISWFMGTVASVQFSDPKNWPNSPWRLLQVIWDEPDLLQNVKCVSPWLVEMVSTIPLLSIPPLSSPRKKLRFSHPMDFTLDGRFTMPSFLGNTLRPSSSICCLPDNIAAGIQGARQSKLGVPFSDLRINTEKQMELLPPRHDIHNKILKCKASCISDEGEDEDISCLLSIGHHPYKKPEKKDEGRAPQFILFGQPILTEQQISHDHQQQGSESFSPSRNSSSGEKCKTEISTSAQMELEKHVTELGPSGSCKVFMGSQDVSRNLDLSDLGSYDELYAKLEHMFEINRTNIIGHLLYHDATGDAKQVGEEPFSDFIISARRLIILSRTSTAASGAERTFTTDFAMVERRMLDSSSNPFSIVA